MWTIFTTAEACTLWSSFELLKWLRCSAGGGNRCSDLRHISPQPSPPAGRAPQHACASALPCAVQRALEEATVPSHCCKCH